MIDIVALGELLIDFTPVGTSESGMSLYERNPGGAPANVAVAASRLGLGSAFIGKVGDDIHGRFLKSVLINEGVDVTGLISEEGCPTTLAFVELKENGDRDFAFVRKGCGDTRLTPGEVDVKLIQSAKLLHVGTLSLTDEPARSATLFAAKAAKDAGVVISCDVNWRQPLWSSIEDFKRETDRLLPYVDLLKVSDNEVFLLTGNPDYKAAAETLMECNKLKAVAVTLGDKGAYLLTCGGKHNIPALPTAVIDTTGAGDCFWGAFLYSYLTIGGIGLENARFGCAAASVCVERRGAIPAMPILSEVLKRFKMPCN